MRLIRIVSRRRVNCPRGEGLKAEKWDLPWLRCAAAALQLCPAFKEASGEVSVYPSDVGSSMRREELPMQGSCVARLHPVLAYLAQKGRKRANSGLLFSATSRKWSPAAPGFYFFSPPPICSPDPCFTAARFCTKHLGPACNVTVFVTFTLICMKVDSSGVDGTVAVKSTASLTSQTPHIHTHCSTHLAKGQARLLKRPSLVTRSVTSSVTGAHSPLHPPESCRESFLANKTNSPHLELKNKTVETLEHMNCTLPHLAPTPSSCHLLKGMPCLLWKAVAPSLQPSSAHSVAFCSVFWPVLERKKQSCETSGEQWARRGWWVSGPVCQSP